MSFDPDAFLAGTSPKTTNNDTAKFDPDAFLADGEEPKDGALTRGIKNTGFSSKMSAQLALNDTQGLANTVKESSEYNQANPGMPEGQKLSDAYNKGEGFWGGVGNTIKQIGDDYTEAKGFVPGVKKVGRDLRAMGEGIITQVPNAIAPMIGTFGGAALGAAAGSEVPIVGNVAGAIAGSLVGGSAGNALVEGGGQVQDGLQKAGIDAFDTQAVKAYLDENRGQLLKQTGIKSGVLGVVDTVTGGAAHALLTGPLKSATTRALTALGIDEADHAAVAAAKKSGAIDALVKNDEKYLASQKGAENIARNAGAAALEPVGEFTGEYFGQGLASDDWDTKNAGLEALSSIGQSAGTFGVQKAIQYGMSQGGAQNATEPSDNPTNPNPANPGSGDGAGVDPLARPDEARSRKQQIQEEIDLIQSKGSDATQEDLDREKRLNQQLMFEEANERIAQEKIKVNGQQNLTNNSDGAGQDAINLSEIAGQLPPQKPSERMGLDPNAGALSDAAALSVDSGASGNFFLPGEDVIPWDDPVATNGTEQVNPASQWDAMDATQRASVLTSVDGMSDRNGNPNVIANRLSQLNWHNMPLGAQEKVNSAITANVAAPVNNLMQQQEELQPASSIYADQENQNRDRGRADSLVQMAGIKNDPDYDRLGRSQSPSTGAPMVFAPKETLGGLSVIGHPETVTGSDGRKIQTQYAVVEASELQASHDVSGNQNPVYSSELPAGNLKALNNGRTAGIQAAYTSGNADNYKAALIGDAARLGVDPNAIAAMKQPVLVRTYDEANNNGDMGAWSNASEGLRLSAAEQANNDARVLGDLHDVVLDDDGKLSPTKNMNLIHRFVNSLPSNEASALRKRDGSVNLPAVEKRIQHAMLAIGFNNDDLINAATEDTEQSRNLMSALTQSAAGFAKLPAQAAIGTKRLVVRAAEMYQKARESGTSVEQLGRQQDLMGGYSAHEEAIADYMEKNIRAPKKVAMVLGWLADYENHAHQSQGSMFGDDLEATKDAAIAYANQRIKQEFGNDANLFREQPATDHGRGTGATTGAYEGATERAGRSGGAAFGLTSQTEQQLAEQEAAQAAAKEEAAQREKAAQDKANADAEVGQFTLTGSDRAADVAAAQGQQDIFSGGRREPETPDHATRWQSMSIEDRKEALKQEGGWPTQANGLSVIGQQLAQQDWSKLPSGMRDKIQGLMDKAQSTEQQSAPKQNPETKAVLAEKPEAVQQKANDILREGFSDEQYRMDSMQTRQKIADKLKNAQVSDEKGIKSLTQLWMARVVVGAKQLNMLPSEYYSRFMEGEIKRGEALDDDSSHLYSEKDDAFGGLSSEQVALLESLGLLSKPQQEVFRELGENQWGERYVRPAGYVSSTQRGNEEVDLRGEKHQFLSDFEASVTGRGSALARAGVLAEIRKLSERISSDLGGEAEKPRVGVDSPLGPFEGYRVNADIVKDGASKTLHVEVYGKEQIEAGLTDEPALLFTVSENGEFIVNGPSPNGETFREFQKRGWAEHAHDKAGNIEPDYTRLTPTAGHKTMPMDQLKPLLADVHARVRAWRKEDQVGLYWVRSTGATGGVLGRETAVFFQKGKGTKQGAVNPTTKDITLSEKDSDASTFLHETGHIFLETQIDMAGMANAGAVVQHDADTVLKWFGIAGDTLPSRLATWNAMTLEEKRPFHEQYAESFEQYLLEGKAPSNDLKSAFDNFRRWLKQVYKSIKAFLASHEGAKLNDDVRAVFDRLLATEEQIQEMEKARNAKALAGEKPLLANPAETKAFEEAAQTVVDNVASGNTEIGKAKEPASILNTSQSKYIAAQAKEQGIKKGSPGYDAAIKKLEAAYGEDLNKALAALPFEQFHEWNVKDGSKSENMNRKAWEALRDEYGIEDVGSSKMEPASASRSEPETQTSGEPAAFADETGAMSRPAIPNARGQISDASVKRAAGAVKLEDFGEKLEGKRSRAPRFISEELSDSDIANKPLSEIWPADAHEKEENKATAALMYAMRGEIPAKPRKSYRLGRWVERVKSAKEAIKDGIFNNMGVSELAKMFRSKGVSNFNSFADRLEALYAIERDQWKRLGDVAVYPNATRYEGDKAVPSSFGQFEVDGKRHRVDGAKTVEDLLPAIHSALGAEAAEKRIAFEIRHDMDGYFISKEGDRERRALKRFPAVAEARAFLKNNYDDVLSAWNAVKDSDNVKKEDTRRAENRPRTGKDYRKGKDATPDMFSDAFGFRGVEFGKWVTQGKNAKERQGMLNLAYDALHDLAAIVGIPPKAISLNGTMGLAFGSRGSGNASAHFERGNLVINLTKTKGAGTLAHEWFHALDNYFSRMRRGGEASSVVDATGNRKDSYITYQPEAYYEKDGQFIPAKDFEKAAAAGREGFKDSADYAARGEHNSIWRQIGSTTEGWVKRDAVRPEVEQAFADLVEALNASPMLERARKLDKNPKNDYWSRIIERGARAFENYVISKMRTQGYDNDYLANVTPIEDFVRSEDRYPYLLPSEEQPIVDAFDALFGTIQTKESDDGKVVLFSRAQSTKANYENRIDELFAGAKPSREGVRVLDEADVLSVLGYGEKPLVLKESKVSSAPSNHPKMTADYWKKVPEWLENPVAVFESDTKPGDLVFIPNEMVGGNVVFVTVSPDSSVMNLDVHVLTNGYDRNNYEKTPFDRWMKEGKLLYVDLKNSPAFNDTSGLQLPRVYRQARGFNANIKTERDLGNYRQTNGIQESLASHVSTGFSVAEIKESLSKTFGHAADKLQRLGLVTVVQTEKEAMDLAYKARAEKAGKDVSDFDVKYSETGDVQGFYDKQTGKSFLVADNLTDETASSVLVHEVGIHMAADTTNPRGKRAMDGMIQRAGNLLKLEKSAFMDSVRQRMKEAGETSNEEAAAYIAEEYEANRANAPSAVVQWVKDFIAAVRGWLFQRGVIVKDNMLTAADIAAIARSNVKQAAKRNGIVGLAKTQQARNVVQEPGERYETDLFGNALPPANKRRAPANTRPESAGVSGDIQPATPLSDTEAPAGDYFVRTIVGQEVARKLGASRITTPEEAAQATQYLYKSAVERLDGIVTDKNGKPLGVVGGFKGELASSSVYPSTIVAEAIRIPGAAAIWFSHNHPSGLANLSRADINLSRTLTDIFRGSGIEPMGLLAVAGDMFDYVDADGDQKYPTKIPAPESSAVRVPVIERELGSENSKPYKIEHPQDAIYVGELMRQKGGDGIMLLNSQHEVVAWVPISDVMRGDLRDTGGLAAIYRAISEANAGAAVIVHGGTLEMGHPSGRSITVGQNIAAALSKIDVRVLDIVDVLRMVSSASTGVDIAKGPVYSRKTNEGLHYSRAAVKQYANRAASELNKTFSSPNTLNWWHKTVGTMYNLAERSPAFKRVFDAAQGFIDDVSHYANDAADFAPTILPKLEKWSDIAKTSIASADNKAIEKPIHEGTLAWTRREDGSPVKVEDLIKESKTLSTDDKIARLLRSQKLQRGVLKMWQGMSPENLQKRVDSFYDKHWLKAGVVWNDSELKQMFGLNDKQVGLYKEYRAAIDRSLDTLARADMLRFVGEDAKDIKDAVMDADNIRDAAAMLTQHLMRKAKEDTDREKLLMELVHGIHERHDKVNELQKEGYAPLSRFGKYTVDVVDPDTGERQYFSMFETKREANAMAEAMRKEFGDKAVSQGTLSDEAYKLFSDMSPETLELFGNMLGLESTGDNTQDIAFQEYLKLTKTNRSAMRRLIHRQGIVGYSQDMPRILANFVYSNARQTAAGLNMGEMGEALNAIPKAQGELKDAAIRLADYVKNPREEAQAVRGLLFAQYLGGSVASAMVNMTQPFAVSFPYLTQFTSVKDSAAQLGRAAKELAQRNPKYDPELTAALHRAIEDGVVAPQEIHQLMAQARGSGTLSIGDGTKTGEAAAAAKNAVSKLAFGWGKVFSMAEQVNRQMTFVAAYRIAKAKGMDNAEAFARKAVVDTQFQYSKANKMQWGRGAVGGTLMTFKTYSIAYVELLHRMYTQGGPEGKRAALLALGVLMLMGGAGGLPFEEDLEDAAEALAQKLGYNISIKQKRQEFLSDVFGNGMANFIENGITGLPGIPIDVSGRLGMGNLIPGTGLLKTKTDHTRDVLEIAGPIGDLASRVGSGVGRVLSGDVLGGALEMSPVAIRNAVKGIDMASKGMYRDQKGYKVLDTNPVEAASKAIGFQPQGVARIQEANAVNQQQKAFYNLRATEIRSLWAQGIFEKDSGKVDRAREQIADWNEKNPEQRMVIAMPSVWRRVREMNKTKDERIAATAPKAMRQKMRESIADLQREQ